jgi:hypothetical protein
VNYANPSPWAQKSGEQTMPSALGVESPREMSAVDIAMNQMGNSVEEAHCRLDLLEQRISCVLQPAFPTTAVGEAKQQVAPAPASPLVEGMRGHRMRLEHLITRINDLRSRLDS